VRGRSRFDRPRRFAAAAHPVMRAAGLALVLIVSGCGAARAPPAAPPSASAHLVRPVYLSPAQIARLPVATTFGRLPRAPRDPDPFEPEMGLVLHPTATRVIYARPGGAAVAALPTTQLGSPTWIPVVQSQRGWDRVLLPSRPNRSTGWIYLGGGGIQVDSDAYRIEVNLASDRLTVSDGRRRLGSWAVAVGAAGTPTPTGRTFLLASVAPVHPTYSPLILPLGLHSKALGTFDGGPGTVGLHGWPDPAVFGHAVSHGCVRVPAAALRVLSQVPMGSSVMITVSPAGIRS
jgi:L,D-transpeptidase catalytic domain